MPDVWQPRHTRFVLCTMQGFEKIQGNSTNVHPKREDMT